MKYIEMNNHKIIHKNNKKGKGGLAIGIRKDIAHLTKEIMYTVKEYESMWVILSNNKIKLRIGLIYAPQESKVNKFVINNMYQEIKEQKLEADKNKEIFMILGDFNCKIGQNVKNSNNIVSKYGENLIQVTKKENLKILNNNKNAKGTWTRIEGNCKSVIDYILISAENEKSITEVYIDEEKMITPYHINKNRTIYSDHCAIVIKANWYIKGEKQEDLVKIIDENALGRFKKLTNQKILTKIAKGTEDLKTRYTKWQKRLNNIIEKSIKEKKNKVSKEKNLSKKIRKLYKIKRHCKIEYLSPPTNKEKIAKYKILNQTIKQSIKEEEIRIRKKRIEIEIMRLEKSGKIDSQAFWKFKKRMDKKTTQKESACGMLNDEGIMVTKEEEIKKVYTQFYENLFKPETIDHEIERRNNYLINIIKTLAKHESKKEKNKIENQVNKEEIEDKINKLKKKRTNDSQGINNILIKNAGRDFIDSLVIFFNEIRNYQEIPVEWEELLVKSIYKNKGSKNEMDNRRGLFMTSIISKLYEKIILDRNSEEINEKTDKFQSGGIKGRSTIDNIMILNEIIAYNKYLKRETYIVFADAYKCFDKLNLKNCIIDLYDIIGARDAINIYKLNEKGTAKIQTPVGITKQIEANNIVRQGTLSGPKLCGINTGKINKCNRKCRTNISNIGVEMCTFVDDINYATSKKDKLKKAVENLKSMEKYKGYTFNVGKEKTAILIVDKKKKVDYNLDLYVKKGKIESTNQYKYLGMWYNNKGDHSTSINKRKEKIDIYIKQIKIYGNENLLGRYAMITRINIYKTVVRPTMVHNVESWNTITRNELNELEKMQANILKRICKQKITTSYEGLLAELGIWSIETVIEYKKVMLLHNILNSDNNRSIKEIIEDQIIYTWKGCWTEEVKVICEKYQIKITELKTMRKAELRNKLKKIINDNRDNQIKQNSKIKTKLRFIKDASLKNYIKELEFSEAVLMMEIRLNMVETKCNYKNDKANLKCNICNQEDTTEHLLQCIIKSNLNQAHIINQNAKIIEVVKENLKRRKQNGINII